MCNRLHQSEKVVEFLREHGVVIEPDLSLPSPKLFPSSKVTPRNGLVVRRQSEGNRPLVADVMAWGVPCWVADRRAGKPPGAKLEKLATNVRNYSYSVWKPLIAEPAQRCLVPFSHFAEPHPDGGKGDDGLPKQAWFSMPGQAAGVFAGIWTDSPRGRVFAFLTTRPNAQMQPIHEKAMPVILRPDQWPTWLDAPAADALALAKPYDGELHVQVATPPA